MTASAKFAILRNQARTGLAVIDARNGSTMVVWVLLQTLFQKKMSHGFANHAWEVTVVRHSKDTIASLVDRIFSMICEDDGEVINS